MTRALLALALWCLCTVVGLRATRVSAEAADRGQRVHKKWIQNLLDQEENKHLEVRAEQGKFKLDQQPDTSE